MLGREGPRRLVNAGEERRQRGMDQSSLTVSNPSQVQATSWTGKRP